MTDFKIGDVVRLKTDGPNDLMLIIRGVNGVWAYCESKCLNRRQWEKLGDMELVRPDPQAEIKQAIRDVLLSDEFMKALAAAWMKIPSLMAITPTKRDQELIESLRDCPFCEPATEATNDPT